MFSCNLVKILRRAVRGRGERRGPPVKILIRVRQANMVLTLILIRTGTHTRNWHTRSSFPPSLRPSVLPSVEEAILYGLCFGTQCLCLFVIHGRVPGASNGIQIGPPAHCALPAMEAASHMHVDPAGPGSVPGRSGERGVHFPASVVATTAARLPSYTLEKH